MSRGMNMAALALGAVGAIAGVMALVRKPDAPAAAAPVETNAHAALDRDLLTRAREMFRAEWAPLLREQEARQQAVDATQERLGALLATAEANWAGVKAAGGSAAKGVDSAALDALRSQITAFDAKLKQDAKDQAEALSDLVDRIVALEDRPVATAAAPVAETGVKQPSLPDAPVEDPAVVQAEITKALLDIGGSDRTAVWGAIEMLRKRGVISAIPAIEKVLVGAKDHFLRQAAAAALGTLAHCDAVPALAEGVVDSEEAVAQQSWKSLLAITGYGEELSPQARIVERRKARGVFLAWWKSNEAAVRTRLGQTKDAPAGE